MSKQIKYPFLELHDANLPYREEILEAMVRVVDSGRLIGGKECLDFENQLAEYVGTNYCVGVSNGLDALRLIFRAYIELGVLQRGDEVIVPANTYIASVLAITDTGLKPVFVEPDPRTLNLDWEKVENALTDRTRALLTVHLYGRLSWNDKIVQRLRSRGIVIVEDNAQAIGAMNEDGVRTGALGDAAAFSFYPTKNLGALGDAGAVTTSDGRLSDTVRAITNYGSDFRYHNIYKGLNCRLDSIQAAVLSVKLKYLDGETKRRKNCAKIYLDRIQNSAITLPLAAQDDMVWHQFVIQVADRPVFTNYLDSNGVGWDVHYSTPPHLQPCYSEFSKLQLPITEKIANTVVSLPISPTTSTDDIICIADIINRFDA